jgi:hypothetical protein
LRVRESLRQLALYRRFQTSLIAMRLATTTRLPGSDPIWAEPDVVQHRELNAREQFQWALATAIIRRLVQEVRADPRITIASSARGGWKRSPPTPARRSSTRHPRSSPRFDGLMDRCTTASTSIQPQPVNV